MNSTKVSRFFASVGDELRLFSLIMSIDPVRLARIRARLLAAATLAVPACGGNSPHVNEKPKDEVYVNYAHPDPPKKPVDGPVNEHVVDQPPPSPDGPTINTPPPGPEHINRPKPDANNAPPPSPKDIPPPGQTINVVKADQVGPPHTINTVSVPPKNPPPSKKPIMDVNRPDGQ